MTDLAFISDTAFWFIIVLLVAMVVVGFIATVRALLVNIVENIALRMQEQIDQIAAGRALHDAKLDVIWEGADSPMYRTDEKLHVVSCNQKFMKLFGFTEIGQVARNNWIDLIKPESRPKALEQIQFVQEVHRQFSFDFKLKDGRTIKAIGYPMFEHPKDREGFLGYSGILVDISVQRSLNDGGP